MIHKKYPIQVSGSDKKTSLYTYIIEDSKEISIDKRPLILICPGGGYFFTSDREAEMLALTFNSFGYHVAVLRYTCAPATYPTALCEVAKSIELIRTNANKWHVDTEQIIVAGASAGGHLACSFSCFYNNPMFGKMTSLTPDELKPAGTLLLYPVITSGPKAHKGSFENLLGATFEALKGSQRLKDQSLENQVHKDMGPFFIWHCFDDNTVPVENSLLLASSLRKKNISTELHIYPTGGHGLGLASNLTRDARGGGVNEDCTGWINLAHTWLSANFPISFR